MSVSAPRKKRSKAREVFHERKSDILGAVKLYAPVGPTDTWKDSAWELTTEKGEDAGGRWLIKAEYLMIAFNKPYFIDRHPEWLYEDSVDFS